MIDIRTVAALVGGFALVVIVAILFLRVMGLKPRSPVELEAERDFLGASVAWWRHVDKHGGAPAWDEDRLQMTRLNIRARQAWHKYREFLGGENDKEQKAQAAGDRS